MIAVDDWVPTCSVYPSSSRAPPSHPPRFVSRLPDSVLPGPHRWPHHRTVQGAVLTVIDPKRLRNLAAWYREFAERTANPAIWEMRLTTAESLEVEATRLELRRPSPQQSAKARVAHLVDDRY